MAEAEEFTPLVGDDSSLNLDEQSAQSLVESLSAPRLEPIGKDTCSLYNSDRSISGEEDHYSGRRSSGAVTPHDSPFDGFHALIDEASGITEIVDLSQPEGRETPTDQISRVNTSRRSPALRSSQSNSPDATEHCLHESLSSETRPSSSSVEFVVLPYSSEKSLNSGSDNSSLSASNVQLRLNDLREDSVVTEPLSQYPLERVSSGEQTTAELTRLSQYSLSESAFHNRLSLSQHDLEETHLPSTTRLSQYPLSVTHGTDSAGWMALSQYPLQDTPLSIKASESSRDSPDLGFSQLSIQSNSELSLQEIEASAQNKNSDENKSEETNKILIGKNSSAQMKGEPELIIQDNKDVTMATSGESSDPMAMFSTRPGTAIEVADSGLCGSTGETTMATDRVPESTRSPFKMSDLIASFESPDARAKMNEHLVALEADTADDVNGRESSSSQFAHSVQFQHGFGQSSLGETLLHGQKDPVSASTPFNPPDLLTSSGARNMKKNLIPLEMSLTSTAEDFGVTAEVFYPIENITNETDQDLDRLSLGSRASSAGSQDKIFIGFDGVFSAKGQRAESSTPPVHDPANGTTVGSTLNDTQSPDNSQSASQDFNHSGGNADVSTSFEAPSMQNNRGHGMNRSNLDLTVGTGDTDSLTTASAYMDRLDEVSSAPGGDRSTFTVVTDMESGSIGSREAGFNLDPDDSTKYIDHSAETEITLSNQVILENDSKEKSGSESSLSDRVAAILSQVPQETVDSDGGSQRSNRETRRLGKLPNQGEDSDEEIERITDEYKEVLKARLAAFSDTDSNVSGMDGKISLDQSPNVEFNNSTKSIDDSTSRKSQIAGTDEVEITTTSQNGVLEYSTGSMRRRYSRESGSETDDALDYDVKKILAKYGCRLSGSEDESSSKSSKAKRNSEVCSADESEDLKKRVNNLLYGKPGEEPNQMVSSGTVPSYLFDDPAKSMSLPMELHSATSQESIPGAVDSKKAPKMTKGKSRPVHDPIPRVFLDDDASSVSDDQLSSKVRQLLDNNCYENTAQLIGSSKASSRSSKNSSRTNSVAGSVDLDNLEKDLDEIEMSLESIKKGGKESVHRKSRQSSERSQNRKETFEELCENEDNSETAIVSSPKSSIVEEKSPRSSFTDASQNINDSGSGGFLPNNESIPLNITVDGRLIHDIESKDANSAEPSNNQQYRQKHTTKPDLGVHALLTSGVIPLDIALDIVHGYDVPSSKPAEQSYHTSKSSGVQSQTRPDALNDTAARSSITYRTPNQEKKSSSDPSNLLEDSSDYLLDINSQAYKISDTPRSHQNIPFELPEDPMSNGISPQVRSGLTPVSYTPFRAFGNVQNLFSSHMDKVTQSSFDKSIELRTPYRHHLQHGQGQGQSSKVDGAPERSYDENKDNRYDESGGNRYDSLSGSQHGNLPRAGSQVPDNDENLGVYGYYRGVRDSSMGTSGHRQSDQSGTTESYLISPTQSRLMATLRHVYEDEVSSTLAMTAASLQGYSAHRSRPGDSGWEAGTSSSVHGSRTDLSPDRYSPDFRDDTRFLDRRSPRKISDIDATVPSSYRSITGLDKAGMTTETHNTTTRDYSTTSDVGQNYGTTTITTGTMPYKYSDVKSDMTSGRSISPSTAAGNLRPYKPLGSQDMYYVESGTDDGQSTVTMTESTTESTHLGSDDARAPRFPSSVLGTRNDDPGKVEGIYHKDKSDAVVLSTIQEQPSLDSRDAESGKSKSDESIRSKKEEDKERAMQKARKWVAGVNHDENPNSKVTPRESLEHLERDLQEEIQPQDAIDGKSTKYSTYESYAKDGFTDLNQSPAASFGTPRKSYNKSNWSELYDTGSAPRDHSKFSSFDDKYGYLSEDLTGISKITEASPSFGGNRDSTASELPRVHYDGPSELPRVPYDGTSELPRVHYDGISDVDYGQLKYSQTTGNYELSSPGLADSTLQHREALENTEDSFLPLEADQDEDDIPGKNYPATPHPRTTTIPTTTESMSRLLETSPSDMRLPTKYFFSDGRVIERSPDPSSQLQEQSSQLEEQSSQLQEQSMLSDVFGIGSTRNDSPTRSSNLTPGFQQYGRELEAIRMGKYPIGKEVREGLYDTPESPRSSAYRSTSPQRLSTLLSPHRTSKSPVRRNDSASFVSPKPRELSPSQRLRQNYNEDRLQQRMQYLMARLSPGVDKLPVDINDKWDRFLQSRGSSEANSSNISSRSVDMNTSSKNEPERNMYIENREGYSEVRNGARSNNGHQDMKPKSNGFDRPVSSSEPKELNPNSNGSNQHGLDSNQQRLDGNQHRFEGNQQRLDSDERRLDRDQNGGAQQGAVSSSGRGTNRQVKSRSPVINMDDISAIKTPDLLPDVNVSTMCEEQDTEELLQPDSSHAGVPGQPEFPVLGHSPKLPPQPELSETDRKVPEIGLSKPTSQSRSRNSNNGAIEQNLNAQQPVLRQHEMSSVPFSNGTKVSQPQERLSEPLQRREARNLNRVENDATSPVVAEETAKAGRESSRKRTPEEIRAAEARTRAYLIKDETLASVPEDSTLDSISSDFTTSSYESDGKIILKTTKRHLPDDPKLLRLQHKIMKQKEKYKHERLRELKRKEKITTLERVLAEQHLDRDRKAQYASEIRSSSLRSPKKSSTPSGKKQPHLSSSSDSTVVTVSDITSSTLTQSSFTSEDLTLTEAKDTSPERSTLISGRSMEVSHICTCQPNASNLPKSSQKSTKKSVSISAPSKKSRGRETDRRSQASNTIEQSRANQHRAGLYMEFDKPVSRTRSKSPKKSKQNKENSHVEDQRRHHKRQKEELNLRQKKVSKGVQHSSTPFNKHVTSYKDFGQTCPTPICMSPVPAESQYNSVRLVSQGVQTQPIADKSNTSIKIDKTPTLAKRSDYDSGRDTDYQSTGGSLMTNTKKDTNDFSAGKCGLAWFVPVEEKPWRKPLIERQAHAIRLDTWGHRHLDSYQLYNATDLYRTTAFHDTVKTSLQDAFEDHMQGFISRSHERQRLVSLRAEERYVQDLHRTTRDQLFAVSRKKEANLHAHPISEIHFKPQKRTFSKKQMIEQTKKLYSKLPEVKQQEENQKREDKYRTNRLKAKLYKQRIQYKVLNKNAGWA